MVQIIAEFKENILKRGIFVKNSKKAFYMSFYGTRGI
jgi:hypothetical protein